MPTLIRCPRCKRQLTRANFHHRKGQTESSSRQPYCKDCQRQHVRQWRKNNVDGVKRHNKNSAPHRRRQTHRLSVQAEQQLYSVYGPRCWICGATEETRRMCIDHDHATGLVRGLLCANCNLAIGNFKENPRLMRRGALYIERRLVHNKRWMDLISIFYRNKRKARG